MRVINSFSFYCDNERWGVNVKDYFMYFDFSRYGSHISLCWIPASENDREEKRDEQCINDLL